MPPSRPLLLLLLLAAAMGPAAARLPVDVLQPVTALPAHIAGTFRDITACHLTPEGQYLVFDRSSHNVSVVPKDGPVREVVQIGVEPGRLLRPLAFDSWRDGTFVIADAPFRTERVQSFFYVGGPVGGFSLPGRSTPRVALGDIVLSGVGSLEFTGKSVLVSQPETGTLVTEYSLDGRVLRSFGELRRTGHEGERDLHLALNAGMPVANGNDGFYFVFFGGAPLFRKFDRDGQLIFERVVQGVELDAHVRALPQAWPARKTADGEFPIVPPTVRTAAVDERGQLWLSLVTGHTYVYDPEGDKRRIVQFKAAGTLTPGNLYFPGDGRLLVSPGCYTFRP